MKIRAGDVVFLDAEQPFCRTLLDMSAIKVGPHVVTSDLEYGCRINGIWFNPSEIIKFEDEEDLL